MAKIKKPIQNYYKDHISPPLAKIFYPTADEFADPYSYVESIRDEGREYGVIKIIPPADFKPPFSLARSLEFKPRSQRLSMTDAFNREHYLILDKLKVYYRRDETKRKPPKFGREMLNLAIFCLAVDCYEVRKDPKNMELWNTVAMLCNIDLKFAPALKLYYYSVICPFRVALRTEQQLRRRARTGRKAAKLYKVAKRVKRMSWEAFKSVSKSPSPTISGEDDGSSSNSDTSNDEDNESEESDDTQIELPDLFDEPQPGPSVLIQRALDAAMEPIPLDLNYPLQPVECPGNLDNIIRKRSSSIEEEDIGPIVKRVRSHIPTPPQIITDDSAPSDGYPTPSPPSKEESPSENIPLTEPKIRRSSRKATALKSYQNDKKVFSTDNQQPQQHSSRQLRQKKPRRFNEEIPMQKQRELLPFIGKVPKKIVHRKRHRNSTTLKQPKSRSMHLKPELVKTFFEAPERFSLQKFREHADAFKAQFFNAKKASDVTVDEVERVFWKNVGDLHSDLFAFYGADLNSGNFGSGFPLRAKTDEEFEEMSPDLQYYSEHPWNLNNLPIASQSAFYHLEENISGMTIPWVYVGMCFSLFCWHVEDHWTYSINYMHEGETKVWYGIPEKHASKFDYLMRQTAPELFEEHPDLLHHMSTMAHPQFLLDNEIDVFTVRQNIGEIVITFPRAYHAGFNAGYNVAEAVNFAPYDWLRFGRLSLNNYADVGRACVFSHDSLVLSMAKDFEELDPTMLQPVIEEYTAMINRDLGYRKYLKECGFNFSNLAISLLDVAPSDDIRSCIQCNTLLYSAAVICPHLRVTCPLHFKKICKDCKIDDLRFAYSSDPVSLYMDLKEFVTISDPWLVYIGLIRKIVQQLSNHTERYGYEDLISIKETGEKAKFPMTKDVEDLDLLLNNFEEFAAEVQSYLPTFEEATLDLADTDDNRTYFPPLRDESDLTLEEVKQKVDNYPIYSKHLDRIMEHYILKADGGKDRCQQIIDVIRNSSDEYKVLLIKAKEFAREFNDWPQNDSSVLKLTNEINRVEWLLRIDILKRISHSESFQHSNEIRDEAIKAGCKIKVKEFTTWTLEELEETIKEGEKFAKNCPKVREELKWLRELHVKGAECEHSLKIFLEKNEIQGQGYEAALAYTEKYVDRFTWLDGEYYNKYYFINENCLKIGADVTTFLSNMTLYAIEPLKAFCLKFKKNILLRDSLLHQIFLEGIERVEFLQKSLIAHFRMPKPYYRVHDTILGRYDLPELYKTGKFRLPHVPETMEDFELLPFMNNKDSLVEYIQENYEHCRNLLSELHKVNMNPDQNPQKSPCVCGTALVSKNDSSTLSAIRCIICAVEMHIGCAPWHPFFDQLERIRPGVYMCPRCIKSKRPYLEDLNNLLTDEMNDSADYFAFTTFFNLHKTGIQNFLSLNHQSLPHEIFRREANVMLSSEIMNDQVYEIILNHTIYEAYFTPEQLIRCQIIRYLSKAKESCPYIEAYIFEPNKCRRRSTAAIKDSTISKKPFIFDIDEVQCRAGKEHCIHPLGKTIAIKCTVKGCNNFYHFTCIPWNLKIAETCETFKCHKCLGFYF